MELTDKQTRSAAPRVGIIIVTFNHIQLTLECLDSLSRLDYPNLQIILVDNNSTDGTPATIRARYPAVQVVAQTENLGFAAGNNCGIQIALAQNCAYLVLLNNDTIVAPSLVREIIAAFESDARVGIVGPRVCYYDAPTKIWFGGGKIEWREAQVSRLLVDEEDTPNDLAQSADYVAGAALGVKRAVIEKIGMLDPNFYFYFEEVDWCWRAQAGGYEIRLIPRCLVRHHVSATIGVDSPATTYYMTRNAFLFFGKNFRGFQKWWAWSVIAFRELRVILALTLKPRNRPLRQLRDIRVLALRDALRGHWGQMTRDAERLCRGTT